MAKALQWCKENGGVPYYESSAKTAVKVAEAFEELARKAIESKTGKLYLLTCDNSAATAAVPSPTSEGPLPLSSPPSAVHRKEVASAKPPNLTHPSLSTSALSPPFSLLLSSLLSIY